MKAKLILPMKPFIYTNRSLLVKQTKLNISFIILCLNFEKNLFNKISLEKSLTRLLTHLVKKSLILKFNALLNSDINIDEIWCKESFDYFPYVATTICQEIDLK